MLPERMMLHVILLSCFVPAAILIEAAFLEIDQGTLNGTVLRSRNGDYFHAFYGIPYAQPPVGQLRFEPPQAPPPSWLGVREATEEPAVCPQLDFFVTKSYVGSEDCLFLQVFTRDVRPAKLAPVLVFFHGGGFSSGSGNIVGPQYFMDKPVVLITVNSRLGIFGFFSTGDPTSSGNYGLKDQVAALQWIRSNIRAFGGDPDAVTIMGQSSGAGSVHLHTLSPLSKDLFHRVIIHSGAANHPMSFTPIVQAQDRFWNFQQHASCLRATVAESVACLKTIPQNTLKYLEMSFSMRNFMNNFRPVIENPFTPGAFLTTNPMKHQYESLVPMIIGFTSNEAGAFSPEVQGMQNLRDDNSFYARLPQTLMYNMPENPNLELYITSLIKKYYFDDNLENVNQISASQLLSDVRFKMGIVDAVKAYPGVKYVFEYDYRSPRHLESGAPHSEDLKSFFPFKYNPNEVLSDEQRQISEMIITLWTNFITTGDPNVPDVRVPLRWEQVKAAGPVEFLHIANYGLEIESDVTRGKSEVFDLFSRIQTLKHLSSENAATPSFSYF